MHHCCNGCLQTTLTIPVEIEGTGLHTAVHCCLRLLPAPADTGIVFRRTDLDNFEIEAHVRNVARVSYATSLMKQSVLLSTQSIFSRPCTPAASTTSMSNSTRSNCPSWMAPRNPSSISWLKPAPAKLRRRRRYIRVLKPLEFNDGDRRIGIYPASEFRVHCFVDYNHPAIGPQEVEMSVDRESFSRELAAARTFGFVKDFAQLQEMGLIRGGSLANALVLDDTSLLNGPVRFPDEYGRHKALDLIGDLALVGRPLQARIVAHKAGHACIPSS